MTRISNDEGATEIFITGCTDDQKCLWLNLLEHYEVDPTALFLNVVKFVRCESRVINLRCKYLMMFDEKIHESDGYFIVPGFTRFGINTDGVVRSIKSKRILKPSIGPYGYPYVNIYDPDKKRWRSVGVHILMARVFVRNDNPFKAFFVNHRDGNKLNMDLKNLEWVTSVRNQQHAIETGLRSDNFQCKLRDTETGKVLLFPSVSRALTAIGVKAKGKKIVKNINGSSIPHLFKGRYEIKALMDGTDWYYKDKRLIQDPPKLTGPFQVKHLETGNVFEMKYIKDIARLLGVSNSAIEFNLKSLGYKSLKGYLLRMKSSDPWPEVFESTKSVQARVIRVTNIDLNESKTFDSIRSLTRSIPIDKRTLKCRLKDNKPHHGYRFEELRS